MKDLKEESVHNDEILIIVNEIKIIIKEDRYNNESIKDVKKDYPEKIKNLEEALLNYMGENDLKILKKEFPDKWKQLTKKLAYPYEYFNRLDDYQKHVDSLRKEYFFNKLKKNCPSDEEIERTKKSIKRFNIKNGEELTQIYLKSDVLLLTCVLQKFIKVSINEFDINPLYCVSLRGYSWQCGLKQTEIILKTLQDKDMILLIENNISGGIGSIMGNRYVKSDENKKILYVDDNNLYGYSMSQPLPYDEIKFVKNVKIEDILNTPEDNDIGYFVEVDLGYPDKIKERTKNFPFCPGTKVIHKDDYNKYVKKIKPNDCSKSKNIKCDWADKKKYLIHYRLVRLYVRHGMTVDKTHEIISFKQSKGLENYINFNTHKISLRMTFRKTSLKN